MINVFILLFTLRNDYFTQEEGKGEKYQQTKIFKLILK